MGPRMKPEERIAAELKKISRQEGTESVPIAGAHAKLRKLNSRHLRMYKMLRYSS